MAEILGMLGRAAARLEDQSMDPRRAWRKIAREDQLLPTGAWRVLLLLGGRGSGKTRSGAQGLVDMILSTPEPAEWAIVAPTYRDAWATCVEGESGLLVALGSSMAKIRSGDCPIVLSAARGYAEVRLRNGHTIRADSADDGALRIQGRNLSGAWCVARGTLITTIRGSVPIEQVRPGDLVMTRAGWRKVVAQALTKRNAPVVKVTAASGDSLTLTADHKVWTENHGWKKSMDIVPGDAVLTWQKTSTSSSQLTASIVIKKVESAGSEDVYDLTVDRDHEYVANGILVKNCDEIGLFARWETAWDESIAYAVRKGGSKIIATGTPKVSRPAAKLLRRLITQSKEDSEVIVRRLKTTDNLGNLSETFFRSVVSRATGTRLERQELEGELLDDNDEALWSREIIEETRIDPDKVPDLVRVVVALDPAVTSMTASDETGIVVAGEDNRGHGYVLADLSLRASPQRCMERAVAAYHQFGADRIIGEANNGGDFIGALLRTVDPDIPYQKVVASRGKAVRAEPVSSLYEQRRIHHAGVFTELEDEMVTWAPGDKESPDRLDACVWAISALRGLTRGSWGDAYGVIFCKSCTRGFLAKGHERCPHCGTAKPEEDAA